jgi:NAD(P)-dependent dehydrogenase (short-subunit alcohol dehydrogenase family)
MNFMSIASAFPSLLSLLWFVCTTATVEPSVHVMGKGAAIAHIFWMLRGSRTAFAQAHFHHRLARIPAKRWGVPDDLKGITVFLASPASDYISGAVIPVDGGFLAR